MKIEIKSICWNITEQCNENCKFCYRKKCRDNTFEQNRKIFDNLSQVEFDKISFCGGEPLLYKDLFSLVEYIHEKKPNIKLSITTNGKILDEIKLKKIVAHFDWISFPIDSTNNAENEEIGRGEKHLNKVIQLLEKCNNKIKVKINTVVTKRNKNTLEEIYHVISKYNIARWKLFRFLPVRGAKDYKEFFYLEEKEAKEVQNLAEKLNEKSNFLIEYNDFEGKPSCFSIQPDGTLENGDNIVIGNLLEDSIFKIIELKNLENEIYNKQNRKKDSCFPHIEE